MTGNLHASLPDDIPTPFVLLDRIVSADAQTLSAVRRFENCGGWQIVEAAAQAAAMHQRYLSGFSDHVFLLSVQKAPVSSCRISGPYRIFAELTGQADRSAAYAVHLVPADSCGDDSSAISLVIGHTPYRSRHSRSVLEPHYRNIFQCLITS